MGKYVDRVGHRYNRLLVVAAEGRSASKKFLWRCLCDCGREVVVDGCSLVTNNTQSCGCYLKERITKHGCYQKASYNTWRAMIRRCIKPEDKDFKRYGANGVKVCARWVDYLAFAQDMGEPSGDQTLDRIDPYGDYTPENCRWASMTVQARNIRLHSKNKTGATGVGMHGGRWFARITSGRKAFKTRLFATFEEAVAARKELEQKHWGVA